MAQSVKSGLPSMRASVGSQNPCQSWEWPHMVVIPAKEAEMGRCLGLTGQFSLLG